MRCNIWSKFFDFLKMFYGSCVDFYGDASDDDPSDVVKNWMGKHLVFPLNIPCTRLRKYTPCLTEQSACKCRAAYMNPFVPNEVAGTETLVR